MIVLPKTLYNILGNACIEAIILTFYDIHVHARKVLTIADSLAAIVIKIVGCGQRVHVQYCISQIEQGIVVNLTIQ